MVAATVLAQTNPAPAEVVYPPFGASKGSAWRVGEECYLAESVVAAWGWKVSFEKNEAVVSVESQTFRTNFKVFSQVRSLPVRSLVAAFGGATAWRKERDTLDVWSKLQSVELNQGHLEVASSLPTRPAITYNANPPSLVVELRGVRMDGDTAVALPREATVREVETGHIRIVVPCEPASAMPAWRAGLGSSFKLDVSAVLAKAAPENTTPVATRVTTVERPKPAEPPPVIVQTPPVQEPPVQQTPPVQAPPVQQAGQTDVEKPPVEVEEPLGPPKPDYVLQAWKVEADGARETLLALPYRGQALESPRVHRPELNMLVVELPGARLDDVAQSPAPLASATGRAERTETGLRVTLTFPRAVGVQFHELPGLYRIRIVKPDTKDGRLAGKTVVLDPGHGGNDPGAQPSTKETSEKLLTLSIAKKTAEKLLAAGATVLMTREADVFVPLADRPALANRHKADFFVSIHINSNARPNSTSGTIAFYHKEDPIGKLLAECLQQEIVRTSGLRGIGVWSDQRIYNSGFAVLRGARVPAVLLELGFINHNHDRKVMQTAEFQDSVASSIVKGLKVYLGEA
ncbi:MAG: hypothetical protein AMXMBFR81_12930 [Chthonomonas sp.]